MISVLPTMRPDNAGRNGNMIIAATACEIPRASAASSSARHFPNCQCGPPTSVLSCPVSARFCSTSLPIRCSK